MTQKARRIEAIDATRGTAMLFVFLSHFELEYFQGLHADTTRAVIHLVAMMATPTFMIISGMMLGYLHSTGDRDLPALRRRFIDRGLFFFLVGHALISLAYFPKMGSLLRASQALFITDVIGLCLVAVPFLLARIGAPNRIVTGVLGYAACWVVVLCWSPQVVVAPLLKNALFGSREGLDPAVLWYSFSLLPWLCLYLCFTVAGERLAVLLARGSLQLAERFLARLAASFLVASLTISLTLKSAKRWNLLPSSFTARDVWLTIYQKTPPGPTFVLFYGGIGIAVLCLLMRFGTSPWLHHYFSFAKTLGQVTFFAFMLQYFVYESLFYSLHLAFSRFWPLYFAVSVSLISAAAYAWHRHGFNAYLTLRPGALRAGSRHARRP